MTKAMKTLTTLVLLAYIGLAQSSYLTSTIVTGTGLKSGIQGSSFKPGDDVTLYVGSIFNGTIAKVNANTGQFLGVFIPVNGSADDNQWTPDGKYIVWNSVFDGIVRSWDGITYTPAGLPKINEIAYFDFPNGIACYYNNSIPAGQYNIRCAISTYPVNSGIFVVDPTGRTPAYQVVTAAQLPAAVNAFALGPNNKLYAPGAYSGSVYRINIFSRPSTVETIITGYVDLESCRFLKGNTTLLCLDSSVNTVYAFDPSNNFASTLYVNFRNKTYFDNFQVGSDNSLYLSDSASNNIVKVSPNKFSRSIIYSQLGLPTGLSYYYEGGVNKIYLADYFSLRLFQSSLITSTETFSRSNTIVTVNDEYGEDLSFGIENIYVTSDLIILVVPLNVPAPGSVQVRNRTTNEVLYDLAGVNNHPYGIAYLSDGSFVVADYPSGLVRFTPTTAAAGGYTSTTYYSPATQNAVGLAADPTQNNIVYLSAWDNGQIKQYNFATRRSTIIATNLIQPEGITFSTDKSSIVVAETGRDRIVSVPVNTQNAQNTADMSTDATMNAAGVTVLATNIPFGITYKPIENAAPDIMSGVVSDRFGNIYYTVDSTNSLGIVYNTSFVPNNAAASQEYTYTTKDNEPTQNNEVSSAPSSAMSTTEVALVVVAVVLGIAFVLVSVALAIFYKRSKPVDVK